MTTIEAISLVVSILTGVALPVLLVRARNQRDLEIKVARLEEKLVITQELHTDVRGLRDEIGKLSNAIVALEARLDK